MTTMACESSDYVDSYGDGCDWYESYDDECGDWDVTAYVHLPKAAVPGMNI
jgi:hypothetical protein